MKVYGGMLPHWGWQPFILKNVSLSAAFHSPLSFGYNGCISIFPNSRISIITRNHWPLVASSQELRRWQNRIINSSSINFITSNCCGIIITSHYMSIRSNVVGIYFWKCLNLLIADPPYFITRPRPIYQRHQGQSVTMPCVAEGDPKPTILWRKVSFDGERAI